jgi:tetraacyldisaccharide 4'-kinase
MQAAWQKIITNKSNPLYWPMLLVLWIIAILFRIALGINNLYSTKAIKLKTPVISVGNLTVGGSGKTPMTIKLAQYLLSKNKKVGIVASGYGRKNKCNIILSGGDLSQVSTSDTGDEIKMMAEKLPDVYFAIYSTKSEAAVRLQDKFRPDIIIIDDGFQHRKLFRDVNLLLIDAGLDLRKEALFPLGRRREPLGAIRRAGAVIITKANMFPIDDDYRNWISAEFRSKPMAEVEFLNESLVCDNEHRGMGSTSENIYFFAAIGSFDILLTHLRQQIPNIIGSRQFPDHCRYESRYVTQIKNDIDRLKPDYIITTQKDFVKIKNIDFGLKVFTLDLELRFKSGEKPLLDMIDRLVER